MRQTSLNATLQKRLCRMLESGSTLNGACAICGIASRTFREWRQRAESGEPKFSEFFSAVTRAREAGKDKVLRSLLTEREWRARAWWLERCYPDEFGRPEPRTITVERKDAKPSSISIVYNTGGKSIEELTDFPTDDDLPEVAREKQARLLGKETASSESEEANNINEDEESEG